MDKISIRFFNDMEVRAIWNEADSKWYFSVLDIVGVLNEQSDYEKNRNYWKYLKAKLKKENNQLGSVTTQFKLTAPDGKKYGNLIIKTTAGKVRKRIKLSPFDINTVEDWNEVEKFLKSEVK